jgi:hypothetical protein
VAGKLCPYKGKTTFALKRELTHGLCHALGTPLISAIVALDNHFFKTNCGAGLWIIALAGCGHSRVFCVRMVAATPRSWNRRAIVTSSVVIPADGQFVAIQEEK